MRTVLTATEVESAVRGLVEAHPSPMGAHVTTPVLYANGDFVEVVVTQEGDAFLVHDAGLGGMHIETSGVRIGRDMMHRVKMSAERYDCSVRGGRIIRVCAKDDIAMSVALVSNASRTVGDLAAEARRQNESQFRYVVTESIREIVGSRLRENESFKGKSGRTYRVQNVILDRQLVFPFAFAVPLATRSSVPAQFRELFDLRAAFPSVYNESIYNDAGDFRPDEDGWILSQVGDVVPISALKERLPALVGVE